MMCNHEWVYENILSLTDPPQQKRICRLCGEKETVTRARFREYNYNEIIKQFSQSERGKSNG